MVDLFWIEQTAVDVPPGDRWLGPREKARLSELRIPKRRDDWRLGRWTAKLAVASYLDLGQPDLSSLEVLPDLSGAPLVYRDGHPVPVSLSLSHRESTGFCVVAEHDVPTGCDLELVEPRNDAFLADYFTSTEQAIVSGTPVEDRHAMLTLLWSAKESVLKALHEGLRMDPRDVSVSVEGFHGPQGRWNPFRARVTGWESFRGWWTRENYLIRTVTGVPPPNPPTPLKRHCH
jgi:4'-phosphopantetheinyl transferase